MDSAGSFYAHIRVYGLSHQGNISRFCTAGRKSGGGFYEVSAGFFCDPFGHRKPNDEINYETDNGFVSVDTTFNSVRHIVLDPVFKGADIDVSFGNVILDLKKTTLEADETIINIDSSFSGVVIYVPKGWLVRLKVGSFLAGCQDMRELTEATDMTHTLYICGDLSFSGLELRD